MNKSCVSSKFFPGWRCSLWKSYVETNQGTFLVEVSEKGIYRLCFPRKHDRVPAVRKQSLKPPSCVRYLLRNIRKQLRGYMAGGPISDRPMCIDETGWSRFERNVLRTLRRVRRGNVISYSQLAALSGYAGAARAVGTVMRKNRIPVMIPCHRVIHANATLGRYSGGVHWKRRLLSMEGLEIKNNRIVYADANEIA